METVLFHTLSTPALLLLSLTTLLSHAPAQAEDRSIETELSVAGMSVEGTRDFLDRLKQAVAAHDAESVAALTAFPLEVAIEDKGVEIRDSAQFIDQYASFMTPALAKLIESTRLNELFANYQGAMIGNGALWFGPVCRIDDETQALDKCDNPPIRIITINGL